ncbi:MAG: hypothetical protein KDI30_11455, partial [Pseudomonadales bacterium]|nr:hypothetical protein [Pseudomonadales bacterium]
KHEKHEQTGNREDVGKDGKKQVKEHSAAEENTDKQKALPKGLEKKRESGKALPPGWQKKLVKGEVLDQAVLEQATPVEPGTLPYIPANNDGEITVKVDNKFVRLINATHEIVDIIDDTAQ